MVKAPSCEVVDPQPILSPLLRSAWTLGGGGADEEVQTAANQHHTSAEDRITIGNPMHIPKYGGMPGQGLGRSTRQPPPCYPWMLWKSEARLLGPRLWGWTETHLINTIMKAGTREEGRRPSVSA